MDPITIFQIVGAAVSLGDVVVKCISNLTAFKSKFHDAPVHVSTMIGQLHIVQIALLKLAGWNQANGHSPRYLQLAAEIGHSLDSFEVLILALDKHLNKLESPEPSNMSAKSRMTFIWSEKEIVDFSSLLDRQVNALTLLLQAIQCETWRQQQTLMDREENRSIVSLARDCATSILGLVDDARSITSETTANISIMFDFDSLILRSKIYQQAQRSHLRQAIRAQVTNQGDVSMSSNDEKDTITDAPSIAIKKNQENETVLPSPQPISIVKSPWQSTSYRWNTWLKKAPRRKDSITSPAADWPPRKILTLGISESGKSTLLKALSISLRGSTL